MLLFDWKLKDIFNFVWVFEFGYYENFFGCVKFLIFIEEFVVVIIVEVVCRFLIEIIKLGIIFDIVDDSFIVSILG